MKKRQHKLDAFKKVSIDKAKRKAIKGGYKYGPANIGFYGSNIWENIDIRSQVIDRNQGEVSLIRNGITR
ncbi:MAG TPA: hypothetical protein VJ933_11725 [Phaeodactylibacter sp.]|nr:hypothetical protein [Phaeodactylibacter sp.]